MGVPTGYSLAEPGSKQLGAQAKPTTGGSGSLYGDLLSYVTASSNWQKATSASLKPFGFNANTQVLTETKDVLTGIVTATRGSADAETNLTVAVGGTFVRVADGVIAPGRDVMPTANSPLDRVKQWDGVAATAIIGRYVRNITQHHDMDAVLPSTADLDIILIEKVGDDF